jgi:hypothetical protein
MLSKMPTYACTVMPSICELSFSKAVAWIQHEISPDHDFLIGQTEWLCANHATGELSVAVPRNDQPVVGGCNLAYNSPGSLWNHWKGNNEKGAQAEYRVGRDVQRFWICTGPLNFFPGTLIALLTCLSCGFCNQVLTASCLVLSVGIRQGLITSGSTSKAYRSPGDAVEN